MRFPSIDAAGWLRLAGLLPGQCPEERNSLKARAVRGSVWTVAAMGTEYALRFASSLILTRLLLPEAFGLVALASVVMTGLTMFSDIGVAPAIVRDPHGDDPKFLNTLWTAQAVRGVFLWIIASLAAWPLAIGFGQPQLVELLPVAAAAAVFDGLLSTKYHLLRRHMLIGRLSLLELVARAIGIVITITLALLMRSVWALIIGWVIGSVLRTTLSHLWLAGPANRFEWHRESFARQYHFGKWIFLSSVLYFVASQGDRVFLGKLVEMDTLGVYAIAVMLATTGWSVMEKLVRGVLFPAYGRVVHDDPQRLPNVFYRTRLALDAGYVLPCMVLAGCGALAVVVLYDPRYSAAGWMFEAMAIRAAMMSLTVNIESGLVAMGHSRYCFVLHAARTTWILAGIPIGWWLGGIEGVVWAVAMSEVPALVVLYTGWSRHRMVRWPREALTILFGAAGLVVGIGIEAAIAPWVISTF